MGVELSRVTCRERERERRERERVRGEREERERDRERGEIVGQKDRKRRSQGRESSQISSGLSTHRR